jgi:hypothetical protein
MSSQQIEYDDPLMEPTARGHIYARVPFSIALQADATGLRLLATLLPEALTAQLDVISPHPAPRASLVLYAAKLGGMLRLAQAEGLNVALRADDLQISIDITP